MRICLATNYLILDDIHSGWWSALGAALRRRGWELALFTTNGVEKIRDIQCFYFPYLLRDFPQAFPGLSPEGVVLNRRDLELCAGDAARTGGAVNDLIMVGLLGAKRFWQKVLEILDPGCVLAWDAFSPHAVMISRETFEAGIPCAFLERGLLPGTFMVESRGMHAWSDLQSHWLTCSDMIGKPDPARYEVLAGWYHQAKPRKYHPQSRRSAAELRRMLGLENRKVVLVLGQWDACGLVPSESRIRRCVSSLFASSAAMVLEVLRQLEGRSDVAVVFKPHPLDKNVYAVARIEGAHVVEDEDPRELLELADVVVAGLTTLQFEAVFHDKPVVLVGRSAWWGYGATYEVQELRFLGEMLEAALRRERWELRRQKARSFLVWLMDHYLVGCSTEVPARRNLDDLAAFVTRLGGGWQTTGDVGVRMTRMREQLSQWSRRG